MFMYFTTFFSFEKNLHNMFFYNIYGRIYRGKKLAETVSRLFCVFATPPHLSHVKFA